MTQESQDQETIIIKANEAGERLDIILTQRYPSQSRSYFQYLIKNELVSVNGIGAKKRLKLQKGDEVEVRFALTPEISLAPENIPLDIIYEDNDLLAINKVAGMTVHPAPGNWNGTFVNALLHHCNIEADETLRPGIVHRLDKDTSGILLAAKNNLTQRKLIELFSSRSISKKYMAVCIGNPGTGTIDAPIARHPVNRKKMAIVEDGGRNAITSYNTIGHHAHLSLVDLTLHTGRTHQLRVHMQFNKTPILGDPVYGIDSMNKKFHINRQLLHAYSLKFCHPHSGRELFLTAPPPADMQKFIEKIIPGYKL